MSYEATKIDLYIIQNIHTGGNASAYIKGINLQKNGLQFNKRIINFDNTYNFRFDDNNTEKNLDSNKHYYKGAGTYTAVYSIQMTLGLENPVLSKYKDKLILRIFKDDNLDKFINQWKKHKNQFPENIIDIFFYGDMRYKDDSGTIQHLQYVITREYYDYLSIERLQIKYKKLLFLELLKFLDKIENEYYYNDLKYENIGFDIDETLQLKFIVLDYDIYTLSVDKKVHVYTYIPPYYYYNISNPIYNSLGHSRFINEDQYKDLNIKYFHIAGLGHIIIKMFFDGDNIFYNADLVLIIYKNCIKFSNDCDKILNLIKTTTSDLINYIITYKENKDTQFKILLFIILFPIIQINFDYVIKFFKIKYFIDVLEECFADRPINVIIDDWLKEYSKLGIPLIPLPIPAAAAAAAAAPIPVAPIPVAPKLPQSPSNFLSSLTDDASANILNDVNESDKQTNSEVAVGGSTYYSLRGLDLIGKINHNTITI